MHPIEDVSFHAGAGTVRPGHWPPNATTLARLAISPVRHRGFATVPDGQRYGITHPWALLALAG